MVVNSCLEDLEGRVRLKRMWKLVPQTGKKEQLRKGGNTNSRLEGQDRGRLGQTMGVGRNGGQERMHRVDKMDTGGKTGKRL